MKVGIDTAGISVGGLLVLYSTWSSPVHEQRCCVHRIAKCIFEDTRRPFPLLTSVHALGMQVGGYRKTKLAVCLAVKKLDS